MNKYIFMLGSFLTLVCFKTHAQPVPKTCPVIGAIKTVGFSAVERDDESGGFVVGQIHQYKTPQTWGFAMLIPFSSANTEAQALKVAKAAVPFLAHNYTTPLLQDGKYYCLYTARGFQAGAVTPIPIAKLAKTLILQ